MIKLSETILHSVLTSVLFLDKNLHVIYANSAALELLGQSTKKIKGAYLFDFIDYSSLDVDLLNKTLSKGHSFIENEVNIVIQNQYHVFYLVAQQFNEDDILFEMMPLNTHKKIAQEQLQHAQQIAARDLVRSLAHEIKNPLGGLRGAAQLLSHELQDQECKDYTKIIIEQADRLRNLVDRLLGPQQIPQKQKNNIHQAIERTYAL